MYHSFTKDGAYIPTVHQCKYVHCMGLYDSKTTPKHILGSKTTNIKEIKQTNKNQTKKNKTTEQTKHFSELAQMNVFLRRLTKWTFLCFLVAFPPLFIYILMKLWLLQTFKDRVSEKPGEMSK